MISISMLRSFWLRLPALLARLALLLAFGLVGASAGAQTTVTFFHNDILGSPTIATGADGTVVWKENYLPYGHRQAAPAAGTNNKLWFAGKPFDPDTGLSYMGARYYIPLVGRFTGVDPQGIVPENPHSFNRYAYANNNPYKYVDPDGRSPALAVAGIGVLLIGGTYYALAPPSRQQEMRESIGRLSRAIGSVLQSESAGSGDGANAEPKKGADTPGLPTGVVGDQSDPRAGPNKNGGKWTSGTLAPENGGTGDFGKDLDHLTGGVRPWQPGDKAPPGSLVGPNGIFGRPSNSSGGSSIDIPANGSKPHETLHYP